MCGVSITALPIPRYKEGFYFEIEITEIVDGMPFTDGVTLGVTHSSQLSFDGKNPPSSADEVPETWAIGCAGT